MEKIIETEGVAAKYDNKYWGLEFKSGGSTSYDFVSFDKARIADPEYCKNPTDMTWNPHEQKRYNPDYEKLSKAKLVRVKKIVTINFEEL